MNTIDEVKRELIDAGKRPDDFDIKVFEDGYSIVPKMSHMIREITLEETLPVVENLSITGREVALLKLANIQKDNIIDAIGQELAMLKLQFMMGGGI